MTAIVPAEIVPLATKDTGGLEIISEVIVRYRVMTYRIGGREYRRVDQLGDPINVVPTRTKTGEGVSGKKRKWSDAEEQAICSDYQRPGASLKSVAEKWGGTAVSMADVLERHGIPRRPAHAPKKTKANGDDRPISEKSRDALREYAKP